MKGKIFGKLEVLGQAKITNKKDKNTQWFCRCECGNLCVKSRNSLVTGHVKSCGCLARQTKNIRYDNRIYKCWHSMIDRCYSPKNKSFKNYGAKGICVCDEWKDNYNNFYDWAISSGYASNLTIDRKDSNGNYCPDNCRWISLSENVALANKENVRRKPKFLYYGISPEGKYFEFPNAEQFARNNNLRGTSITRCANGIRKSYKGWIFGFTEKEQ